MSKLSIDENGTVWKDGRVFIVSGDEMVKRWNAYDNLTAEVERLREALNMAKTSMLDSGYSKESTILMVINKALEGGDE